MHKAFIMPYTVGIETQTPRSWVLHLNHSTTRSTNHVLFQWHLCKTQIPKLKTALLWRSVTPTHLVELWLLLVFCEDLEAVVVVAHVLLVDPQHG